MQADRLGKRRLGRKARQDRRAWQRSCWTKDGRGRSLRDASQRGGSWERCRREKKGGRAPSGGVGGAGSDSHPAATTRERGRPTAVVGTRGPATSFCARRCAARGKTGGARLAGKGGEDWGDRVGRPCGWGAQQTLLRVAFCRRHGVSGPRAGQGERGRGRRAACDEVHTQYRVITLDRAQDTGPRALVRSRRI